MTKEPAHVSPSSESPRDDNVDVNAATAPALVMSDARASVTVALADLDPSLSPEALADALRELDPTGFDLDLHAERMLALLEAHRSVHGVTAVHRVAHEILQRHWQQKRAARPDN